MRVLRTRRKINSAQAQIENAEGVQSISPAVAESARLPWVGTQQSPTPERVVSKRTTKIKEIGLARHSGTKVVAPMPRDAIAQHFSAGFIV